MAYSGLFKLYDSTDNINNMNSIANQQNLTISSNTQATIIPDKSATTGVAIVTRVQTQNVSASKAATPANINITNKNV